MYPHERSLVKRLKDKPFALLGINSDGDREDLKQTMKKEEITWPSWWDGGSTAGPIASAWNVEGWPTLYLVDHKGVIRFKHLGFPGAETFDKEIDQLLKDAEAAAEEPKKAEG